MTRSLNRQIYRGIFMAFGFLAAMFLFNMCTGWTPAPPRSAPYRLVVQNDYVAPVLVYVLRHPTDHGRRLARVSSVSTDTLELPGSDVLNRAMFRVCAGPYTGTSTDVCGVTHPVSGGFYRDRVIFLSIGPARRFRELSVWVNG